MFFMKQFNVLAVDDEPDVLAVMKMALRNVTVWGVPVNLITAGSKAEAIKILDQFGGVGRIQQPFSVILLDVVMETDTAGLEVADYVRNVQNNFISQIHIITGQPGVAPEKEVIDRYDISGYLSKTQMDETKLYSLVKSGIRDANTVSNILGQLQTQTAMLMGAGSRAAVLAIQDQIMQTVMFAEDGTPISVDEMVAGHWVDGSYYPSTVDEPTLTAAIAAAKQLPEQSYPRGDGHFYTDGAQLLVELPALPNRAAVSTYVRGTLPITPLLTLTMYHLSVTLGVLYAVSR